MARKSKRYCGGNSTKQHVWVHVGGRNVRCMFCTRTKTLRESEVRWGKLEKIKSRNMQRKEDIP